MRYVAALAVVLLIAACTHGGDSHRVPAPPGEELIVSPATATATRISTSCGRTDRA
jgi:hypothetical protein